MKTLREKLHSQRGASILLALLFLLVCMMVAASVLMAAVSNAGKIRSNYEEQQRYLSLSSALRLVAGEIEQAKYHGRYTVNEWTEVLTVKGKDADGKDITIIEYPYHYYNVEQKPGTFACGKLAPLVLDENGAQIEDDHTVLTFRAELDGVFAGEFSGVGFHALKSEDTARLPTNPPDEPNPSTRKLEVKVQDAAAPDGQPDERFGTVTVAIDMSRSCRIHLKATLDAETSYVMEAELAPRLMKKDPASGKEVPAGVGTPPIDGLPEDAQPKDKILNGPNGEGNYPPVETGSGTLSLRGNVESEAKDTSSYMTWKLDWISREIKEASG